MRTEKEILKDFEKLGYKANIRYEDGYLDLKEEFDIIHIHIKDKIYTKSFGGYDGATITMEEHKLLHELFAIWGWLE